MSYARDVLVAELCTTTARTLERIASDRQVATINERDFLQPACVLAAREEQLAEPSMDVLSTVPLRSETWPRLGAVDIAFVRPGTSPVLVELKAGVGRHGLIACAWDALKLAFALQTDKASDAYLLAATPTADWENSRGSVFFATQAFESEALRDDFADGWKTWERDGYPAGTRVPARFTTREIIRSQFLVGATPWELRLAAVHVPQPPTWIAWFPLLEASPGEAPRQAAVPLEPAAPAMQRPVPPTRHVVGRAAPELVICADWSKHPARRRAWLADPRNRSLRQLGVAETTVAGLVTEAARHHLSGSVLIAFDAPIGVPLSYLEVARRHWALPEDATFVDWLPVALGQRDFLEPVTESNEWSVERPFFRVPKREGGLRSFEAAARELNVELKRSIEKATRGNSVFAFDLPGQVAPAAQTLWQELAAVSEAGVALWPFDGTLDELATRPIVLGEIFPRAAYGVALDEQLPAKARSVAKRQLPVREAEVDRLLSSRWLRDLGVEIEQPELAVSNEDDFDALLTAAALLRLQLERQPFSTFAIDPIAEGGILAV